MKTLKKHLALLLTFLMCFNLVGCAKEIFDNQTGSDGESVFNTEETLGEKNTDGVKQNQIMLSKYTITVAKNASELVLDSVVTLSSQLSDINIPVTVGKNTEYEFLLGDTGNELSVSARAMLDGDKEDYIIQFKDKKIIICAKNEIALQEAVYAFIELYASKSTQGKIKVMENETYIGEAKSIATLAIDGKAQYEIVFGNVSSAVKSKANELITVVKELGKNAQISIASAYSSEKNQIVIGRTSSGSTNAILSTIKANEYVLQKVDNKIIVSGQVDDTTVLAIDALIALIRSTATKVGASNTLLISLPNAIIDPYSISLDRVPKFNGGTYTATYSCGNSNKQLYYTNADPLKINAYIGQLEINGYLKKEDNTIGNNRYVTCLGRDGLVHITYMAYNSTLSVVLDPLNNTVYKESEPQYTKITENNLAVMSIDYESGLNKLDGNGLSYVVTLEDGRYIIFDGGYATTNSKDAHILYNYLVDNNKRTDKKIVIAAWIFTHPHADHFGAFEAFCSLYGSRVSVEYFIYNDAPKSMYKSSVVNIQYADYLYETFPQRMKQYFPNSKVIRPHSGQILTFCNVKFEVMYTVEDFEPREQLDYANNSSLCLRMYVNGVTTLFTGDFEVTGTRLMSKIHGLALKSDILQVSHHGYSGQTKEFFDQVSPEYSLWTTSQVAFDKRVTGVKYEYIYTDGTVEANKYLFDKLGKDRCFAADGDIEIFTFVGGDKKINIAYYTPNKTPRTV